MRADGRAPSRGRIIRRIAMSDLHIPGYERRVELASESACAGDSPVGHASSPAEFVLSKNLTAYLVDQDQVSNECSGIR